MKSYNAHLYLKIVAVALLGVAALPAQADEPQNKPAFADVPPTHWAYNAVQRLARAGIIEGYPLNSERYASQSVTQIQVRQETIAAPEAVAEATLRLALIKAPAFVGSNIQVHVSHPSLAHPVLTLTGTVKTQFQKTLAEQTLKKNRPTIQVVNQLKVISTSSR